MALIRPMLGPMSGKLGANVFSHNRFGAYLRLGPNVTNPNTIYQQAVRTILADLVAAWADSLTAEQRASWETYATNVAMTNRIGMTIFCTGVNHYVRSNVPRLQIGATRIDDAPTIFNLGEAGIFNVFGLQVPTEVSVGFDVEQEWVDEDNSWLILQVSRPQNPTINFFNGPFRLSGWLEGDSVTPPTSPAIVATPFPFVQGQRVYVRARVSRADGRLSAPQISSGIGQI